MLDITECSWVFSLSYQNEHSFQLGDHKKALSLQSRLNYMSSCYINSGQSFLHLELISHLVTFPLIISLLQNLPLFSPNDTISVPDFIQGEFFLPHLRILWSCIEVMGNFSFEIHTSHSLLSIPLKHTHRHSNLKI